MVDLKKVILYEEILTLIGEKKVQSIHPANFGVFAHFPKIAHIGHTSDELFGTKSYVGGVDCDYYLIIK